MTTEYEKYLKSPEWKYIRRIVLHRDNNKCTKCGTDKKLRVHHTTYVHIFHEINYLIDLLTVCDDCHQKIHNFPVKEKKIKQVKNKPPKERKPRKERSPRLPMAERKMLKRVIVHEETATTYKVRIMSLNKIWTFKKCDCKITKTVNDDNGNCVFTFQFPMPIWKEIMRDNKKKWSGFAGRK